MLWKCSVCGFLHEGSDAPEKCPKCGSPKEMFSALSDEDAKKSMLQIAPMISTWKS